MYKNLTQFMASVSPAARQNLARVMIIINFSFSGGTKEKRTGCSTVKQSKGNAKTLFSSSHGWSNGKRRFEFTWEGLNLHN